MVHVEERTVSWGSGRPEPLPPGHRVGAWAVTEPIGSGGWATVYAARPAGPAGDGPEEVALKIMPTAGLAPRQARDVAEAAAREVALGRRAAHPRLIRLLDSFVLGAAGDPVLDGAIVLVMERARGSLRELLDAGVGEAEGARLITGICEGLAHLHGAGWVHTDLKPENILIGRDGTVKLSDFGFAIELTGTHGYTPPMGTLDYLPPERGREPLGERGVRVRPSADIWALGVVVHEVFAAGASPFPGATPAARAAAVREYAEGRAPLRMDHAVPAFWRAFAADCLAPGHEARAAHTAEGLLARIAARPAPDGRRPRSGRGPLRRLGALLALAVCAAAAGTSPWWYPVLAGTAGSGGTDGRAADAPVPVRVFNAERGCQGRADRDRQCSLGLAIDPLRPYTARNVVPTRVWHGDVLEAECRLPDGLPVIDEEDRTSTVWYRVRLPGGGTGGASGSPAHPGASGSPGSPGSSGSGASKTSATAWLPAVRTKDRPALPRCAHPAPTGPRTPAPTTAARP
ncbi:serine/threonine-protein kinase [Streptomyces sp. NPDC048659]|uniref:serine/threonine-protein kinase n=1 Tax=Streptomyces sp. NPDC048659 TaxID=3155489 RepID=UPI003412D754